MFTKKELDELSSCVSKLAIAVEQLSEGLYVVEEPETPSFAEVKQLAQSLIDTLGVDAMRGILRDMGLAKITACPVDHYEELMTRMEEALDEQR